MANNTTNFTLRLRTQGLDEAQKQTQVIRDNLEAAARAAAQVGGGTPGAGTPGGSPGSRRVAASRAASPTGAAGATAGIEGPDVEVYNRARGASNAAGGTARDFADISRGLGGFVRLYATLAANLYAAGAAFNFLRTSMDTANMIKGMDQLGASSGRALGSLSKQLVDATDGAISLREAMEATTKAASAGLSNKQILEIGQVAKNASQALGLNMTDAVSRLTRGIAKLEPELLDELGIFVRIDDATEKYAKTINKTAGELTDFERRQAFATAAISQGQKKFNEIKLDANPYNRLAATLADLAQSAGELINKFLAPVVKYLSESPTALAAALAFIGVKLIKTVVPAFGEYRENLKKTVDETKNRVGQILREQNRLAEERDTTASTRALQQFREANKQKLDDLKQQAALFSSTARTNYAKFADIDPLAMTQADFNAWEKKLERRAKVLDRTNGMEADLLRIHIEEVKKIRLDGDAAAAAAQQRVEQRDSRWYSQMSLTRKRAQAAMREANRIDILDATNKTQQLEGPIAAWRKLNEELAAPTRKIKLIDPETNQEIEETITRTEGFLGLLERGGTRLRGGFGIAVQAVTTFAAAWGPAIAAGVGAALAVFELLDSWLSTNKKEMQEFKSAIEASNSSLKTLEETIEKVSTKDPLEAYNAESITAVATAIKTVSDSIDTLIIKNQKARDASSWWDNWLDSIKERVGAGRSTMFAEAMVNSTLKALNALGSSPEAAKARERITKILEIDFGATSNQWEEAFRRIEKDSVKVAAVNAEVKILSNTLGEGAEKARKLGEALDRAADAQKNFFDKYKVKDEFSLLGEEYISLGIELGNALKSGPMAAIEALNSIAKDNKKISLFSSEDQTLLLKYKKDIADLQQQRAKQQQDLDKLVAEQNKAATERAQPTMLGRVAQAGIQQYRSDPLAYLTGIMPLLNLAASFDAAKVRQQQAEIDARAQKKAKEVQDQQQKLDETNVRISKIVAELGTIGETQLKRGADLVEIGISRAFAGVGNALKNAVIGVTGDLPGVADIRLQMAQEELRSEQTLIQTQLDLIKTNKELIAVTELASATAREIEANKALEEYSKKTGLSREDIMSGRAASPEGQKLVGTANTAFIKRQEAEDVLNVTRNIGQNALKGVKDLNNLAEQGNTQVLTNFKELTDYALRIAGLQGNLAKLADKNQAEIFTNQIARLKEKTAEEQKGLDAKKRELDLDRQSLALKVKSGKLTELQGLEEEERISAQLKQNELNQKELTLRGRIAELEAARGVKLLADPAKERSRVEQINAEIERLNQQRRDLGTEVSQADEQRRIEFIEKRLQLRLKEIDSENKLKQLRQEVINIEQATADKISEIQLEVLEQSGLYRQQYIDDLKRSAQLYKITEEGKRKEAALTAAYEVETRKLAQQLGAAFQASRGQETEETTRIQALIDANNKKFAAEVAGIRSVTEAEKNKALAIAATKTEQDKFAKGLESLKGLDVLFAGLGTALADTAQAFKDAADNTAKFARERAGLEKAKNSGLLTEEQMIETQDKLTKLNKEATKTELSDATKIVGSAKKIFNEKSRAYKTLANIEKAMHIAKLAMDAKELFIKLFGLKTTVAATATAEAANTASTQAGAAARSPTYIGEIYGKTIGQLGPIAGPVVAAALAALVLSYLGGSDKGAPTVGISAAERQEVQGTGMEWRDGKKVETGRGVFGDPEAKSDSVRRSLERIKETNVEGITYASKTVKLLESIDRAIGGAAQELYGVQGLRAGTAFGTQEGTSSSGIQGLFGSRRSTEIIDAGIKFAGTFLDVMMGRAGSIMQYETTRTTKTSSGFLGIGGGTSTWESTLEKDLGEVNQTAAREVSKIFTNAGDLMIELGGQLGQTQEQVLSSLGRVDLSGRFASLRGLKGEELQKELSAVISSILDDAATVAFSSLEKFRKFGEGMAETVIRVLDSNQKISDSFVSMGGTTLDTLVRETFGNQQVTETVVRSVRLPMDQMEMALRLGFSRIAEVAEISWFEAGQVITEQITRPISEAELKQKSLEISEGLAELAGGLDKFLEKQKFFVDNFLTEAERLEPIRRGLTDQLNALGLGFVDTREEFKQVVLALGQNVTTEGGRQLYNSVLDLAPAFNQVYEEVEDVKEALSTLDLRNRLLDQEMTILGLLGREQEALALKRERELAELRKYPGLQGELLAANQEYIYALEDEKALKDKLIKQRDKEKQALETTIKNLSSAIDTLNKYKTSLLTGSMTVLTPEQQYQENKTRFEEVSARLRTGTTEERIAAASELQSISDKFLESSRTMFASSSTYASDFQSVLSVLDESTALMSTQKTDAERSLDELMRTTSFLDTIEDNTKSTSDLLSEYLTAQQVSQEQDKQRQDLRQQWEQSLLSAMTATPEITLDVKPIVDGLVEVKNEIIRQQTEQANQSTASVAVSHADLQSILGEMERLRRAYEDQQADLNSRSYDPMPSGSGNGY